jgi:hypothetical protein
MVSSTEALKGSSSNPAEVTSAFSATPDFSVEAMQREVLHLVTLAQCMANQRERGIENAFAAA